jgi:hypothetical protein
MFENKQWAEDVRPCWAQVSVFCSSAGLQFIGVCSFLLFFWICVSEELRAVRFGIWLVDLEEIDRFSAVRFHFYACFVHAASRDLMCPSCS